ncbi:hypothetical protein [Secundilactobacillus folii]|nr:hypothetical protein [Secundilactobacillus folii]
MTKLIGVEEHFTSSAAQAAPQPHQSANSDPQAKRIGQAIQGGVA